MSDILNTPYRGGLPALLFNADALNEAEMGALVEDELLYLAERAGWAAKHLADILEMLGRLATANESADAACRVPSADVVRVLDLANQELAAAMPCLAALGNVFAGEEACRMHYWDGFNDGKADVRRNQAATPAPEAAQTPASAADAAQTGKAKGKRGVS